MKLITTLGANPNQKISILTWSGKEAVLVFKYLPTQKSWYIDLKYGNFEVNGIKVCCSPNILDKWSNILDFGINVMTIDGLDPFELTSFDNNTCFLSVLNDEEKKQAAEYLNGV